MVSQHTQVLFLQATATETWTQFIRTATIRSGCPATWTACPSRALNVTWRPSSMRLSWMEALWTLILTPRLPLMGFLSGWSPLHTAGCRARVRIRWDQALLWSYANSSNKNVQCMIDCWTICVLVRRFLFLAAATGSWSVEKWKHRHSAQVMWQISSNGCMSVSVMSKRLKPMKISLTANVCKKLKWKKRHLGHLKKTKAWQFS